jgi:hypothetical protein
MNVERGNKKSFLTLSRSTKLIEEIETISSPVAIEPHETPAQAEGSSGKG